MELKQLYYFSIVAKYEHFNKAAQEIHVTQPALSQSIARLEEELGCELFDRTGRNAYLNNYGKEFLKYVDEIFLTLENAKTNLEEMKSGARGSVSLGITTPEIIAPFLRSYILEHPNVHIYQRHGPIRQLQAHLLNKEIDFAILMEPSSSQKIEWEPIIEDHLGVLLAADHPLAEKASLQLADLKNENFVIYNAKEDHSNMFYRFFDKAGFEPKVLFEGGQTDLVSDIVGNGYGVAICSRRRYQYQEMYTTHHKALAFVEITSPPCIRTTGFARLKTQVLSPAAADFYRYLKSCLQKAD